jgi:hypothetical protein
VRQGLQMRQPLASDVARAQVEHAQLGQAPSVSHAVVSDVAVFRQHQRAQAAQRLQVRRQLPQGAVVDALARTITSTPGSK